jgi:TolB-like protein
MGRQLKFGDWAFDVDTDVVDNGQSRIQLEPQVAKVLEYLLQHQEQLLTRDRLINDVWRGRIVSDDAIHRCIAILRQALTPHDRQAFIRTIPKKGYLASFPPAAGGVVPDAGLPKGTSTRKRWAPAAAALLLAALAVPLALDVGGVRSRLMADGSGGGPPTGIPAEKPSIAVLPFADLSPDQDQAYFADGVSEEILNLLTRMADLRVIARTSSFSFRDRGADVATIGNALEVSHILDGSVRKSGSHVRIAAQLVDARTGTQLWSETYDRQLGDILNVQAEIAAALGTALQIELELGDGGRAEPSVDPQAFDFYLRGLQQMRNWTGPSLLDAEQAFRQSIERAPDFTRSWYGLGITLLLQVIHEVVPLRENLPRIREVAAHGLGLEPGNAGFVALQGQVARYDGDEALAERYLVEAMRLDPSDTWIRNLYCFLKMDLGYPEDALAAQKRTLEIDPLNAAVYVSIGFSELDLWNADEAFAAARRFRQLNTPGNITAIGMNAVMSVVLAGNYADAAGVVLENMDMLQPPERTWMAIDLAVAYYTMEDMANGDAWLERARETATAAEAWPLRNLEAYAKLVNGDIRPFRAMRAQRLLDDFHFKRLEDYDLYLLADELIERGEPARALELMLEIAPEWARYMRQPSLPAEEFYPASALVKSAYSSYPAMHFVPFIRVLRANGDLAGAENMLRHLETILESRRKRGLFLEERFAAEARALRGDPEGALDALERAERDRTIYLWWQLHLLHGGVFAELHDHARFTALIDRIRAEMRRQRTGLEAGRDREPARPGSDVAGAGQRDA